MADGDADRRPAPSRSPRLIHRTDLVVAALILAICAALYYATTRFDEVAMLLQQGITPTMFPRLVLGVIVVLTLMVPFEHIVQARHGGDLDEDRRHRIKPIAFVTAMFLIAIVWSMPRIGTILAMVAACAILPLLWGERRYGLVAIFAILFPAFVTVLFAVGLKVNLLPGIVGHVLR